MSSNEVNKSRDEVLAAREAKRLAKLKAKNKFVVNVLDQKQASSNKLPSNKCSTENAEQALLLEENILNKDLEERTKLTDEQISNSKDKVNQASLIENIVKPCSVSNMKNDIKNLEVSTEDTTVKSYSESETNSKKRERQARKATKHFNNNNEGKTNRRDIEITVKDVVETLKDIVSVAKEVQDVTAKVQAIKIESTKTQENNGGKSKAELRAERRAKQEAQRAAKQQAAVGQKNAINKLDSYPKSDDKLKFTESNELKSNVDKVKPKNTSLNRVNWFQHLHMQHDEDSLNNVSINSNLHPAIVKLGVQLATRVVTGSNARCIALLNALKKMVRDYTLPAKTEFARGLESQLALSLEYLWRMRQPAASQTNAVKYLRHHLTQLPNNVDEFDAKKTLQEEIDRYIKEQIEMAGQAISIAVRDKISDGDNILTYGCSSLIERILCEAWQAGVQFRAVVAGNRVNGGGREMLRRLTVHGVPCTYVDITALSFIMSSVQKVVLGASALLVNGSVLGAVGTAGVALAARACNVPVLVACETHKFSERVQTDAFVYNEIGDPDQLVDKFDDNSPLKDWRNNKNLTPLNLTYDVTPPSLVTAVVTELAILPCTSAPVVLRFKLSEYGI
ncbi:hypothetical protein ACJJTC_015507 [Scirpophaga incertulas]